jgi:nucleoside-diphosphate-sugar epimerase
MADHVECTVVTGTGGWLGAALMERLIAEGRPWLRVLAASLAEAHLLRVRYQSAPLRVDVLVGDIGSADTARRLLFNTPSNTTVLHAAGVIHPRRVRQFDETNANGTQFLAEAARDRRVTRMVHVSSNSPFGTNPRSSDVFREHEPFNPYLGYGRSKMLAELAVLDQVRHGLDAVIVRPPWFYGPHQPARQTTFLTMIRAGKFPIVGDGTQRRSMVYVDNLVDGVLAAERAKVRSGAGYWIADAEPYAFNEIVSTVADALRAEGLQITAECRHVPSLVGRVAEAGDRVLQRLGLYQQQLHVLGELDKTIACDISAARRDLGYEPQVALAEGMRRSIRWCLDQGIEL